MDVILHGHGVGPAVLDAAEAAFTAAGHAVRREPDWATADPLHTGGIELLFCGSDGMLMVQMAYARLHAYEQQGVGWPLMIGLCYEEICDFNLSLGTWRWTESKGCPILCVNIHSRDPSPNEFAGTIRMAERVGVLLSREV